MDIEDKDQLLYHYCSFDTLVSIIKKKQLWMSDISRSNDYFELKMFFPNIFEKIEEIYYLNQFGFDYKGKQGINALSEFLHEVYDYLTNYDADGSLTSYVICFTESKDALSQWRGYANNGKGCSIGFSLKELQQYCHRKKDLIVIKKVEYIDKDSANAIIENEAKIFLNKIMDLREYVKKLLDPLENQEDLDVLLPFFIIQDFKDFILSSLKYKWDTFSEEKEWRMFFLRASKDPKARFLKTKYRTNEDEILDGKIDFYTKEDCLIPHFLVELNEISPNPIKQIIFGPKNNTYRQDMLLFLENAGMSIPEIFYSEISYR